MASLPTEACLYRCEAIGPRAVIDLASDRASEADPPLALSVSVFEVEGSPDLRRLELIMDAPVDGAVLAQRFGVPQELPLSCAPLEAQDWVAKSLEGLPVVSAGRFFVRGGHHAPPAGGRVDICLEAGQAFGTGHHGTTKGCLLALDHVLTALRPSRAPLTALDLGAGAGVLAIGLAKATPARVLATDIDPVAVAVAQENARRNQVGDRVRVIEASGLAHPLLRRQSFELILANILAKPLMGLALDITQAARPGARLILSGLLVEQKRDVEAAYRARGWRRVRSWALEGWSTLLLRRPG